ncbi:MAG: phytanoyl-CoA dioxygenase family protein [Planctomycetota bacterium]|nr:phytanoyl-CoA dioxygenase family protein [Planctomycetota bacterium]
MLTDGEVAQYREDGFLHCRGVLDGEDVEALRAACDDAGIRAGLNARGYEEKIVHLHPLTTMHAAFKALAADARILERVARLIGPDLQLQQSKLATKPPRAGKGQFQWHQDFAFFPHTNTDLLAVFVMLDDCTLENGCLHVVRGSHGLGLLDHAQDGRFSGACQEARHFSDPSRVVALEGRAGDLTLHHALTLHASFNNLSGRPRRGAIYQYRAADAYQLQGRVFDDTGWQVRGADRGRIRCDAGALAISKRAYGGSLGHAEHQEGPAAREWNAPAAEPQPAGAAMG